jgi:hypothetical protein
LGTMAYMDFSERPFLGFFILWLLKIGHKVYV